MSVWRKRKHFEKLSDPVAAVHFEKGELREIEMDFHKDVETVDSEAL